MRSFAAGAMMLLATAAALPAGAEAYRLNAQDRLLVRVVAWNFDQDGVTPWGGISGEYLIAPDGTLQFPLAGSFVAQGRTLTELQGELANVLRRNAGLDRPPQVTVELVESLPVYVLGAAQIRGAVAFRPGLTPLQALALAGGVFRTSANADPAQIARIMGEAQLAAEELRRQQAERASVEAGLDDLQDPDADAAAPPPDADMLTRLRAADRIGRQARMASLDSLQALLADKSDKLRQQMVLRDRQLADYRRDLQDISQLKEKGLTVNARVTALTSSINDLEGKRLDLEATLLLAEQQLNEAARARRAIIDDARSAGLQRLADLESEMAATAIRLDTASRLLTQAMLAGEIAPDPDAAEQPGFVVTRVVDGATRRIAADPDMALEPGDVLEITLPQPASPPRPVAAADPATPPPGPVAAAGGGATP